jgi:hypothetical protein
LVDLPNDLLVEVYLHVGAKVAYRATCRKLREAVPPPTGYSHPRTKLVDIVRSVSLVEWAWDRLQGWPMLTGALAAAAAAAGSVEVMQFLASKPSVVFINDGAQRDVCKVAAVTGQYEMLKYLLVTLGLRAERFVAYAAARNGHTKVFGYLDSQACVCDYHQAMLAAASGGQLDFLKWLLRKRKIVKTPLQRAAVMAARRGHANIVYWVCSLISNQNWARTMGVPNICEEAAGSGLLDLLKHLVAYGLDWPSDASDAMLMSAINSDNLDVVKFVLAHGDEWSKVHTTLASACGHLDILKHAHAQGVRMSADEVREAAAQYGQLATLKWSMALDPHLDKAFWLSYVLNGPQAISNGQRETLAWLKGESAP